MIRAKMSLLLFSLFVAVWVFIPARYSNADRVKTETETYSSSSDMDSAPAVSEYKREYRESHQSSVPGSEEKRTKVETYRSSDVDSPQAESDYQYKRERRESHVSSVPGAEEKKSEVETYSRSDTDLAPPVESEHRYEYKSEHRESVPTVREYDRTVVERYPPAPGFGIDVPFFHFHVY